MYSRSVPYFPGKSEEISSKTREDFHSREVIPFTLFTIHAISNKHKFGKKFLTAQCYFHSEAFPLPVVK